MIDVHLFGPLLITGESGRLTRSDLGGTKLPQLVQMLALELGNPLSKDLIAERLWDGRPPTSYLATVESYVCVLRRRLGLVGSRRGPLATTSRGYLLDSDQVRVDVVEARRLLRAGGHHVREALDLVSGELLADERFASWACEARDCFDELLVEGCTRAAHEANARGDFDTAVLLARTATDRGYLCEPAVQELMQALVGVGDRVQALRSYEHLRVGMSEELGLSPGAVTQAQYLTVLRGETAPETSTHVSAREEISALLQMLRRALDADASVVIDLPSMHEMGRLLMARAG